MALRHDDELPPLTPDQQTEAIRLAARLQAEHEAKTSSQALLLAAEEAGIERRFLYEAAHRLAEKPKTPRRRAAGIAPAFVLVCLAALTAYGFVNPPGGPPLIVAWVIATLVSLLFALPPCSMGRSRRKTMTLVLAAWGLADTVFALYLLLQGAWGNFEWSNFFVGFAVMAAVQGLASLAGVETARWAYRLQARAMERRPQSL